tara:strand:- start:3610 stop:4302 length:693 start_codon:yes stop_codon:yes gene_type:complete
MKITKQQLRQIILEEMENMDEGLWDQIKGTFAGVGSALTSPLGSVGQGYRRGKAASVLRSAAVDINKVRQDFVGNIEGLFKSVFSDVAKVDSSMRPVVEKWNEAIAMMDEVSDILQELSVEVKAKASTGPRDDLNVQVAESEKSKEALEAVLSEKDLSADERRDLPDSDFALPGKGEGPKGKQAGSYPIPDEKHARSALSLVAQHGTPAEKAKVRAAVKRKFPDIEQGKE